VALADPSSPAAKSFAIEAANWIVGDDSTGVVKGRMKFCRPVFKAVHRVDQNLSVTVFSKSKDAFHPIARKLIEKVCLPGLFCGNLFTVSWVGSWDQRQLNCV
jgi:leukotriene-A4 hydrolase